MSRGVRFTGHRLIRAPVQRVWHLLSRPEIHPRYTTMWMAADVLERSHSGALVELRGFFGGLPIVSVQRLAMKPPWRLEFRQVRGELRDLSGAYVLKDVDGDTDLYCEIVVDAGMPLFSDTAVEQILAGHTEGTLGRLKTTAERDLVRLIGRRSRFGAAAPAEVSKETDEGAEEPPLAPAASASAGDAPAARAPLRVPQREANAASAAASAGRGGQSPEHRRRGRRRRGRRRRGSGAPRGAPGPGSPPVTR